VTKRAAPDVVRIDVLMRCRSGASAPTGLPSSVVVLMLGVLA
jgi:hypothetical protein